MRAILGTLRKKTETKYLISFSGIVLIVLDLSAAISSLTSVSVLVFVLGFLAARFKSDLRIPDQIYTFISMFLLFGIGLKGGVGLSNVNLTTALVPLAITIGLGILVPFLAYVVLRYLTKLQRIDLGAIAAHYGSTSLVTFSAALVFLETLNVSYGGYATALLAVMEIPGLIIGIYLGSRRPESKTAGASPNWSATLHEILLSKSIVLLVGGLLIGYVTGASGYAKVSPMFVDLLPGVLALFLMHLGFVAGSQLEKLKGVGFKLISFGIVFPISAGMLAIGLGRLAGLGVGDLTVLAVLAASASYIAAPAAVWVALPKANHGLAITAALGVTFPFNLILGIPLYLNAAQWLFQVTA
jgi:hypothetical protein